MKFVINAILATVPAFDAAINYGGWATYAAYFLTMATLYFFDIRANEKSWGIIRKILAKIIIIVIAETFVLVWKTQACDALAQNCHSIF